MRYDEWEVETTQKLDEELEQYCDECLAKRKEILDSYKDTGDEVEPPDPESIVSDIGYNGVADTVDGNYLNNWQVTDNYDSDYPFEAKVFIVPSNGYIGTCSLNEDISAAIKEIELGNGLNDVYFATGEGYVLSIADMGGEETVVAAVSDIEGRSMTLEDIDDYMLLGDYYSCDIVDEAFIAGNDGDDETDISEGIFVLYDPDDHKGDYVRRLYDMLGIYGSAPFGWFTVLCNQ